LAGGTAGGTVAGTVPQALKVADTIIAPVSLVMVFVSKRLMVVRAFTSAYVAMSSTILTD
jgi:hypothetical protein